ncbi:IS1 family transposase [Candidatus Enterovibrio altilux]|uniref:IS1 family transposase n=1 Tax=Candidatus Enterovibrio altilux TaxID=1927128 RepID=UPI000BBBEBBC
MFPIINTWLVSSITQHIKKKNLTLHTHLKQLKKKTIRYTESMKMHDTVISKFIVSEYYLWIKITLLNT